MQFKFHNYSKDYRSDPAAKKQAMASKIGRVIYDGTPTVADPMGHTRGVVYYIWFRPLGWMFEIRRLYATDVCLKAFGIEKSNGA
jgi:hypothetical protein